MVLKGLMAMTWRSRASFGQCFMVQSTNGVKTENHESKILSDSYLELLLQLFLGCSSMLGGSPSRVEMDHALHSIWNNFTICGCFQVTPAPSFKVQAASLTVHYL
ncbi:uncharacterized protein [Aegilops tauschii subsp. strangulata]|uniref:uncharacterized protein isoform X2 n=1 Tax=Aegilops tauschii subsp. strangulata TaxID=200361 RepID=UPI00098AE4B3|nr:uncharacterized protein LOC109753996 isoform X1 [Aegilops tauschii subsp. strangulata]XP_040241694.1 uncharacterized protein LOC109753996 isoform X1 [Aegilops tauschii subsp. strangulata]XP_040241699.1 uncharacterized protein LOC109753996 isoform X1 [Aegilops tauschii subsp. strangulata]